MVPVLRVISSVLSVYMLLLFVRILLSWFSGPAGGKAVELLHRVTEPYLRIFRNLKFLHTSRVDFSPVAALITLVIALNIVNTLAIYGRITVGIILALVVSALGSAAFFIVGFFLILTAARFVSLFFGASAVHPFWQTLDVIVNPVLGYLQRVVFRGRAMTYQQGLGYSAAVLLAVIILGRILLNLLVRALQSIPF